jgi:hypothetical protein
LKADEGAPERASEATATRPDGPPSAYRRPTIARLLSIALVASSLAIFAIWGWLAVTHVDDRYRIDHVSGVHMALAWDANHGVLYRPLYDGARYGGTRYMPLPIVVDAFAERVSGSYLMSGKLLSYGYFVGLLILTFALLVKSDSGWPLALALAAVLPATEVGLAASMNARSDALPVLLQIGAIGLILHRPRSTPTVVGGILAAAAFVTKTTAVWGAVAIVVWLWPRDRRRAMRFLASYAVSLLALIAVFALLSRGRLFSNVFGLSTAGAAGIGPFVRAPYRFFHEAIPHAMGGLFLVPIALAAILWTGRRRASPWTIALIVNAVLLIVILADRGTGWNQFIDGVVLLALVAGTWVGDLPESQPLRRFAVTFLGLTVVWANVVGLAFVLGPDIKESLGPAFSAAMTAHPLADAARGKMMLSEDPYVPVSLGETPVVLDPFMLIEIGRRDPSAIDDLRDRIARRDFDLIVLRVPLDDPSARSWFREEAFGTEIADAIRKDYAYDRWTAGYYLYRPKATSRS